MTAVAKALLITTVPVSALFPSPLNPRKSFDPTRLQALAESIAAQGVLQNLVVRRIPGPKETALHAMTVIPSHLYEIAAGERRWRAVMSLVEAGRLEPTYQLPVVVRILSDLELLEIAMSENVKRADMHPLEEADGYLKMVELGENADSIATAVGVATSSVQKRLKIAENLCDAGRRKLLAGEMTLAQAQALTIAPKKDQTAYLKNFKGRTPGPIDIRKALTERRPAVSKAIFGIKAYTDKGGNIVSDLFDEESAGYFANYDLFLECQREAMEAQKTKREKSGEVVHVELSSYFDNSVYMRYEYRPGHTLLTLENDGEVEVHENRGPPAPREPEAKSDVPKLPQKNKKRLAFEDQALTRAAQHGVYKSQRLAMIVAIAGAFKTSGLRHKADYQSFETRRGNYQDAELKTFLEVERRGVYEAVGEKPPKETDDAPDLLSGPYISGQKARSLLDHLNSFTDSVLETLFRAVTAAHVEAILEGEPRETHLWLLEQTKPDMHDFFTADADYLSACKKDELAAIAPEVGGQVAPNAKKANVVAGLTARQELKEWLPERLRSGEKEK